MAKRNQIDMTTGPLFKKFIIFCIPLILTNLLQSLFHSADVLILGKFAGETEVGAVSCTGSIINLIIGLFIGLSMGANVLVARNLGKNDEEAVRRSIGTSIIVSLVSGILIVFIGYFGARTFLGWTNCLPEFIDMATEYVQVYCLGAPLIILYNFASAIMRASGDTKRPLIFLIIGGVLNIALNLFFVLVVKKPVAGVAIATVASQGFSAILSLIVLMRNKTACKLVLKYVRIYKNELKELLLIGIPSGIQSCLFNLSNTIISKNINDFGVPQFVTGNGIAQTYDTLVYQIVHSIALGALSFVSQNYGAKNFENIVRVRKMAFFTILVAGVVAGGLVVLFSPFLDRLGIKEDTDPESIELILHYAFTRHVMMASFQFVCGWMDTMANVTRGMGKSVLAMIITLFGACVLRILWVELALDVFNIKTPEMLYFSYLFSWSVTTIIYFFVHIRLFRETKKMFEIKNNKDLNLEKQN